MKHMNKELWIPVDGLELEDVALKVVKSDTNQLVIAGPGAGKTELLAQRACYLLQTMECINPKRILAISFKRDAASNLKERVEKRCGIDLSYRFESMTYDAFAKSILDRFSESLPEELKPAANYEVVIAPKDNNGKDKISFQVISNLAKHIIVDNPLIKRAIQLTYSHIFLDEFQDTTTIQYEIVKLCFQNTNSAITAVGDGKQRIMLWAGAKKTIFEDFISDFAAQKNEMIMNHRSAPRLVAIQKAMYSYLNEQEIEIQASRKWDENSGNAFLRTFSTLAEEVNVVTSEIEKLINAGISPREICILTKQTPQVYVEDLIPSLFDIGISARVENNYQDLLSSELIRNLILIMKITPTKRNPQDWQNVLDFLFEINELTEDDDQEKFICIIEMLEGLIYEIEPLKKNIGKRADCKVVIEKILNIIDVNKIKRLYSEYQDESLLKNTLTSFLELFWNEVEICNNWNIGLDNFEGQNSIPIMTIHKSKGLEFEVVIFLGLEDSAFWNFSNQPMEDKCTFFVAVSRAKKRVDFTFCKGRTTKYNSTQSSYKISELYQMLRVTGIVQEF